MKRYVQFGAVVALLTSMAVPVAAETISGQVSDSIGSPLEGIAVEVYRVDVLPMKLTTVVTSGVSGVYQVVVGVGTYSLRFVDPDGTLATGCYGGSSDVDSAAQVAVALGADVSGVDFGLTVGGTVSGTVTAASDGSFLAGIKASLYAETEDAWSWVAAADTDGNGEYTVSGVPAGTYHLEFLDPSEVYLSKVHVGAKELFSGADLTLIEGQAITGVVASLTKGARIEGTVTVPGGLPPSSPIRVRVLHVDGFEYDWHSTVMTEADGTYEVRLLGSDLYKLLFEDPRGDYLPEYLGNSSTLGGGTTVALGIGGHQTGRDIELTPACAVEGMITESGGALPVTNVRVTAYRKDDDLWRGVFCGTSDSNGAYRVQGLQSGAYRVAFEDSSLGSLSEVWVDAQSLDGGSNITVPPNGVVAGQDAQLESGARVAGTVTRSDEVTPLQDIWVTAYAWDGGTPQWLGGSVTDASGQYEIRGLPAGACRLVFDDWSRTYLGEVYDDVQDLANGVDVQLTAGAQVGGVDASLGLASTLAGRVYKPDGITPLAEILVTLYGWDGMGWAAIEVVETDALGAFDFVGLAPGTYRMGSQDPNGDFLDAFYGPAEVVEEGADIQLSFEVDLSGVDMSLELPGTIGGTVTTINVFEGVVGVPIFAERTTTGERTYSVSGAFGWYAIGGLRPGHYRLGTEVESGSIYVDEWYEDLHRAPDQPAPPQATTIEVQSGATARRNCFRMDVGGEVAGVVTAMGAVPLKDATVTLTGSYGSYTAMADGNGAYAIPGIAPDSYVLKVSAPGVIDEWWNGAQTATNATAFSIALGQVLTRDVDLDPGQGQALVAVTSDPPGAEIYLDSHAVGAVTPALVDVGEAYASQIDLPNVAPHMMTVTFAGAALPAPVAVHALEGEQRAIHFDLVASDSGSIDVFTTPAGADVYVDTASAPVGISPITLSGLAPGTHRVFIAKEGYLIPRPVEVSVAAGMTVPVSIPLTSSPVALPASVLVKTVPPRAQVYVNGLLPGMETDVLVDNLDPAYYEGTDWQSMSHVILIRKAGYRAAVPRQVDVVAGTNLLVGCVLLPDSETMTDANLDGLPDEWQDAYDFEQLAEGGTGPDDDPDGDGFRNSDEMRAGTHPFDSASNVLSGMAIAATSEGSMLQVHFPSVPGQRYFIQCIDTLTDPNGWQLVVSGLIGDGTPIELETPLTGDEKSRAYRAIVLTP